MSVIILLAPVCLFLLLKYVVFPAMRRHAWAVSVVYYDSQQQQQHPGKYDPDWALWGPSAHMDARGWYRFLTHTPSYVLKTVYSFGKFLPMAVHRLLISPYLLGEDALTRIPDQAVFDFCTKTSVVIMTKFEQQPQPDGATTLYVLEMDPKRMPGSFYQLGECDLSTLRIVFSWPEGAILEATSKFGPVRDLPHGVGRNEILLMAVRNIHMNWVHPSIHVGSERNALEIQAKRVDELEPSAHIVTSLHDGLLHGSLGPLGIYSPVYDGAGTSEQVVQFGSSHPLPPHVIDDRKERFEMYAFLIAGRREVFRLVRKYALPVDAELLFMNVVMHEIDHEMVYEVLNDLPLCSGDVSGSLWSCWLAHSFINVWLMHWDNPMCSDLVTSNLDRPFYAELYATLSKVNQKRADQMAVSCCF